MARSLPLDGTPPLVRTRYAIFAKGFRPFFLLAAAFVALVMPAWLFILAGDLATPARFAPTYWHAHEMLYGFTVAVIAGFLLTAVGNWTQRETAIGLPLGALCLLWLLGRAAMSSGSLLPPVSVAIADLSLLPALAFVLARPLVATKNRRNYVMLAVLGALFATNVMMHLDALGVSFASGWQRRGALVALDVIVLLIVVITGRIVPSFTKNATRDASVRSIPSLDALTVAMMAILTVADATSMLAASVLDAMAGITGILAAARAIHWGAKSSAREPLLFVLHVGYAWIPLGLVLRAAGGLVDPVFVPMATHALAAGGIGTLTLAMMARVARGHTGRPLVAGRATAAAFVLVTIAAFVRVVAPLVPSRYLAMLGVSGALFAAAFALYLVTHARMLSAPRVDGREG